MILSMISSLRIIGEADSSLASISITLQSKENDLSSTNLGTIAFEPEPYPGYTLPKTISRNTRPLPYQATFYPPPRHVIDHWEYNGGIYVPDASMPLPMVNVYVNGPDSGTLTAVYRFVPYQFTVKAHCYTEGLDISVDVVVDSPPAHTTPYTFTSTRQTHAFTAPSYDTAGHPFKEWNTGQTNPSITVNVEGTYTAYYEGQAHDLDINHIPQKKDTQMLCLEGCSLTGDHAWNKSHPDEGREDCPHDNMYCVRAAISMINSHYGGQLSQD